MFQSYLVQFDVSYLTPDGEIRINTKHYIEAMDEITAVAKGAIRLARKIGRERQGTSMDGIQIVSAMVREV